VGISADQISARMTGMAVMLSVLDMRYGAIVATMTPRLAVEQSGPLQRGPGGRAAVAGLRMATSLDGPGFALAKVIA